MFLDTLGCFELLKPRSYSIAVVEYDEVVKIATITVIFKEIFFATPQQNSRCGLASSYFLNLPTELNVSFRRSKFNLFKYQDRPIILIAAGTGVSPYIGFLMERQQQQQRSLSSKKPSKFGTVHLFFGCRNEDDFIYKTFFESCIDQKILTQVCVAYSRATMVKKEYVQDKMLSSSAQLCELIDKKHAIVYVCGNAHGMAKDVRNTWKTIFIDNGYSPENAKIKLDALYATKRYKEDIY